LIDDIMLVDGAVLGIEAKSRDAACDDVANPRFRPAHVPSVTLVAGDCKSAYTV